MGRYTIFQTTNRNCFRVILGPEITCSCILALDKIIFELHVLGMASWITSIYIRQCCIHNRWWLRNIKEEYFPSVQINLSVQKRHHHVHIQLHQHWQSLSSSHDQTAKTSLLKYDDPLPFGHFKAGLLHLWRFFRDRSFLFNKIQYNFCNVNLANWVFSIVGTSPRKPFHAMLIYSVNRDAITIKPRKWGRLH